MGDVIVLLPSIGAVQQPQLGTTLASDESILLRSLPHRTASPLYAALS